MLNPQRESLINQGRSGVTVNVGADTSRENTPSSVAAHDLAEHSLSRTPVTRYSNWLSRQNLSCREKKETAISRFLSRIRGAASLRDFTLNPALRGLYWNLVQGASASLLGGGLIYLLSGSAMPSVAAGISLGASFLLGRRSTFDFQALKEAFAVRRFAREWRKKLTSPETATPATCPGKSSEHNISTSALEALNALADIRSEATGSILSKEEHRLHKEFSALSPQEKDDFLCRKLDGICRGAVPPVRFAPLETPSSSNFFLLLDRLVQHSSSVIIHDLNRLRIISSSDELISGRITGAMGQIAALKTYEILSDAGIDGISFSNPRQLIIRVDKNKPEQFPNWLAPLRRLQADGRPVTKAVALDFSPNSGGAYLAFSKLMCFSHCDMLFGGEPFPENLKEFERQVRRGTDIEIVGHENVHQRVEERRNTGAKSWCDLCVQKSDNFSKESEPLLSEEAAAYLWNLKYREALIRKALKKLDLSAGKDQLFSFLHSAAEISGFVAASTGPDYGFLRKMLPRRTSCSYLYQETGRAAETALKALDIFERHRAAGADYRLFFIPRGWDYDLRFQSLNIAHPHIDIHFRRLEDKIIPCLEINAPVTLEGSEKISMPFTDEKFRKPADWLRNLGTEEGTYGERDLKDDPDISSWFQSLLEELPVMRQKLEEAAAAEQRIRPEFMFLHQKSLQLFEKLAGIEFCRHYLTETELSQAASSVAMELDELSRMLKEKLPRPLGVGYENTSESCH